MPGINPDFARLTVSIGIEHRERFLEMLQTFGVENNTRTDVIASTESTVVPTPELRHLDKPQVDWVTSQDGTPKIPVLTPASMAKFETGYRERNGVGTSKYSLAIHRTLQMNAPIYDHNGILDTCVVFRGDRKPIREQTQGELLLDEDLRQEGFADTFGGISEAAAMTSSPDSIEVPPYTLLRADRVLVLVDALEAKPRTIKMKEMGEKTLSFMKAMGMAIDPNDLIPPAGPIVPISMDTVAIQYPHA